MAYIDCVIDTKPMADELNTVSTNIKGTTTAVVSMKAAVIAAEDAAAEHVCENVNKGFYTLIHSQISQKIAKLQSEVDSHLMKLNQLRKQLLAVKGRMEHDYGMLSQRYLKLFNGLNKNLQQRVFELDKPTTDFAVKEVSTHSNRSKLLTATVPVAQVETLSMSQKILASNIKFQGMRVINSMSTFLCDMKEQKVLTDRVMLTSQRSNQNATLSVPVLIVEASADRLGNKRTDVFVSQLSLDNQAKEKIRTTISSYSLDAQWERGRVDSSLENEFNKLLTDSSASKRVKGLIYEMFSAIDFQTIRK